MSSVLKKMQKKMAAKWEFEKELYNTSFGSLIVCAYILSPLQDRKNFNLIDINKKFKKFWRQLAANLDNDKWELNFLTDFRAKDYASKIFEYFGVKQPEQFPVAVLSDGFSLVFAPYIDGELYPIRPDGFIPSIYRRGRCCLFNCSQGVTDAVRS